MRNASQHCLDNLLREEPERLVRAIKSTAKLADVLYDDYLQQFPQLEQTGAKLFGRPAP